MLAKERAQALNLEMLGFWRRDISRGLPIAVKFLFDKLDQQQMFHWREVEVAEYIYQEFPISTRIVELASGYGQLSILLASLGYPVTGVEFIPERAEASSRLAQELSLQCSFIPGLYPDEPEEDFDLLVGWNTLGGPVVRQDEGTLTSLLRSPYALLNIRWLLSNRMEEEERDTLLQLLLEQGYTAKHLFSDVWRFDETD